jgi:hypothetical protein
MKKVNEDFKDFVLELAFTDKSNKEFQKMAEALLAKEECNEFEKEILELISTGNFNLAWNKLIKYLVNMAR